MSIDGQLDIFAELEPPVRTVTCPHCHVSWTPGVHLDDDEAIEVHTRRKDSMWGDWPGECANQRMALSWLYARAVPSNINYRGDLLWSLIDVRRMGVDNAHVLGVLAMAAKESGVSP